VRTSLGFGWAVVVVVVGALGCGRAEPVEQAASEEGASVAPAAAPTTSAGAGAATPAEATTAPSGATAPAAAAPSPAPAPEAPAKMLEVMPAGASALARKLAKECDEGSGRKCALLAQFFRAGPCAAPWLGEDRAGEGPRCDPALAADAALTRRLLAKGCEGKAVSSCARLAAWGGGFDEALRPAVERACEAGRVDACRQLVLAEGPVPEGQLPSGERRLRYLNLACSAGYIDACPATMPDDATPAPPEAPRVSVTLPASATPMVRESARRCDANHAMMCAYVGMRYAFPDLDDALPQDLARARELFGRACNARTTVGCVLLGDQRLPEDATQTTESDLSAAFGLYQRACEHHTLSGCARLGALLRKLRQPVAMLEAAGLYLEACAGGEEDACGPAAELAVIPERQ